MTEYAIGYTLYKVEGTKKIPVLRFEAVKGNIRKGMNLLDKRLNKLGKNKIFMNAMLWTMVYGYAIRTMIAL